MPANALATRVVRAVPVYYGWIVLGCVCCACFSRAGAAVAPLSVFVTPMTTEFGWTRSEFAGAVSLGGLLAAVFSPLIGSYLDKQGARLILCLAVLVTGLVLMGLSTIHSLLAFYLLFCVARMNWAGPFDLGIYGAVNNWFVTKRAMAASVVSLAQMVGLTAMPQIGQAAITAYGWRTGWIIIGALVIVVGLLPCWLLIVRRPEDLGLQPDGERTATETSPSAKGGPLKPEPEYTRAQAVRTRAFWSLALFTALIYPVQAGLSLHQAAHLIERGLSPASAATVVSMFSFASAFTGFGYGILQRWLNVKSAMFLAGIVLASSAIVMTQVTSFAGGLAAGILFGLGIGGVHTLLPVAWADYFGRKSFGAIRGIALTVQVAAQAAGPLISAVLRDTTGDYVASLLLFATLSGLGSCTALITRAPKAPDRAAT